MLPKKRFFVYLTILLSIGSIIVQVDFIKSYNNSFSSISSIQYSDFNLKEIGQFSGAQEVVDVFIIDQLAFIGDQIQGLLIINVSNPSIPELVNTYQDEDYRVNDIVVEDGIAYVAHDRAGFKILDVTDPNNIIELGEFNDGGIAWKVIVRDNTVFIADRLQGLEIIDISNRNNPVKIGSYSSQPYDIFVQDEFVYIAAGLNNGLEIIDISDLDNLRKIGEISFGYVNTISIFIKNEFAYLGTKENGLKIVKISRPRKPKLITEYLPDSNCNVWGIYVSNDFVYLACESDGIQILDISEITDPYKIGHYSDDSGKAISLMINQERIFLADFDDGLEILEWETIQPIPMVNDYHIVDSKIVNFNNSVGPFTADAFLGNDTLGLNLSLYLDIGLMSPVNITVEAPRIVIPGEFINLKIGISAEDSYFWGRFEGTIKFTTPLGSSEVFSLQDVGIPQQIKLAAFKTFIGENLSQVTSLLPYELWAQDILNYSLALYMVPNFNISGSAVISAEINNTVEYFDLLWSQDRDEILIPIKIPEDVEEFHTIPLEQLQFIIDDLHIDLDNIRFDVLVGFVPIYSWELNVSSFTGIFSYPKSNNYQSLLLTPNQENNSTLLYLDGIYPLGTFVIRIYLSGNIQLPIWTILLTLLGIIALIVIPWILIASSSRRKNEEQSWSTNEE